MTNRQDDSGALRERLSALSASLRSRRYPDNAALVDEAIAALSPQGSEPAPTALEPDDWQVWHPEDGWAHTHANNVEHYKWLGIPVRALYAAPAPAQQAVTDGSASPVGGDAAIGAVVWKYIDRMNDVCDEGDTAEVILAEFVAAVNPLIRAAITRPAAEALRDDAGAGEASQPAVPYGIIDPDYARVFTIARCLAWSEGYALVMHGSFTRDLDLIAIPWTKSACKPEHLMRRIEDAAGLNNITDEPGGKEHGRLVWTLMFPSFNDPRFVDLSIMPRATSPAAE